MTNPLRPLPSDADVRNLLAVSRNCNDPRAAAAVIFQLAFSMSVGQLRRLNWSDIKLGSSAAVIRDSGGTGRRLELTEFCVRLLLSIRKLSRNPHPFGKLSP